MQYDGTELVFRTALPGEEEEILALYQAQKGSPYVTWDEEYPTMEQVSSDMNQGGLYVLVQKETIIGAVSLVREDDADALDCWMVKANTCEMERVCILPSLHGHGLGGYLVALAVEQIRQEGFGAVRLLAAKINTPARRLYARAGFQTRGECFMYGNMYDACELVFSGREEQK